MKKTIICLLVAVIAVGALLIALPQDTNEYIRIHIRANSNSEYDQNIKYTVKDCVVAAITPLTIEITSYELMYSVLEDNLPYIRSQVDACLVELGLNYRCNVRLNLEDFPTRSYEDLTLDGGIYDALIIELGSGEGDNWWCVAFPPLCFIGEASGETVKYKSIFSRWLD